MPLVVEQPQKKDIAAMLTLDSHIDEDAMLNKFERDELLVAREGVKIVGYIRYGLFWDEIPFLNLIVVSEGIKNQGIGSQLMDVWEKSMQQKGYKRVLTSSLADETAQHFYRKRGYRDIGSFVLPGEAAEIFFMKEL